MTFVSELIAATLLVATGLPQTMPTTAAAQDAAGSPISVSLPSYDYVLSGGDKLRVIVFDEPNLGGDFTISGAGSLSLPLIGDIEAKGLTSPQLQQRIMAKLGNGYLKEPRVAVEVLSTRPFYILGEVNKPGEYAFADGLTVDAAVAQAGGFTYRAKTKEVKIKHAGDDDSRQYRLNSRTPVRPGDTIKIEERWF